MSIIHKIRKKAGFSIAELLVAILILSMVSTVVAGGIPVARDAYNRITVAANAQVLLSTAIYSLRSELSSASDIEIKGNEIHYRSGKNGHKSKISMGPVTTDKGTPDAIMIEEFLPEVDDKEDYDKAGRQPPVPRELVPGMSKDGLHVVFSPERLPESKGQPYLTLYGLTVEKDGTACGVDETSLSIHTMEKVK